MSKSLIPAVPLSAVMTTLWINWQAGVALTIVLLSLGCFVFHVWLCVKIVRARLKEVPEDLRSHILLTSIRAMIRDRLPPVLLQRNSQADRLPLGMKTA